MEKEELFTNEGIGIPQLWNSIFGIGIQGSEVNCVNSMNQRDPFDSAFSSIVSSPANSHPGIQFSGAGAGESIVLRELIGRLESICNSPQSYINGNNSYTNSCYNTPLNSPPKLNLCTTDHQIHGYSPIPGNYQSFVGSQNKLGDFMEESSVSGTGIKGDCVNTNGRKRKGVQKGKGKETQSSTTTIYAKDDKVVAEVEKDESHTKKVKSNEKSTDPSKDYIHVRARRGQATDSHSLAERARREKISERMKFLQGLVPGCDKITGKAVMLDKIINYVKSLQQQVEFLSMKLATVNPRMDESMETLLSKAVSLPNNVNPYDTSVQAFPFGFHSQITRTVPDGPENQFSKNPLMPAMNHSSMIKPPHIDNFGEASTLWENDLQGIVKMALGHDETEGFLGQMKVEL